MAASLANRQKRFQRLVQRCRSDSRAATNSSLLL
jgi:hypothetical protein